MNKHDRKQLNEARALIETALTTIEELADGETEKFENLPEGLQMSERGEKLNEDAEALGEVVQQLQDAANELDNF